MTIFVTPTLTPRRRPNDDADMHERAEAALVARSSLDRLRPVRKLSTRGFTLVELMIVVVIVGVLAVLAVVGFQKLIGSARTTEATQVIQSIRVAQEAFHAETGAYADVSPTLCVASASCANLYPQAVYGSIPVGSYKSSWGVSGLSTAACNTGMDWLMLPVHVQGQVMYGYTTVAGSASSGGLTSSLGAQSFGTSITLGTGNSAINVNASFANGVPSDWYMISATGDEDADGVTCNVLGTSFSSDLIVAGEGN